MTATRTEFAEETTVGRIVWNRVVGRGEKPFVQYCDDGTWSWLSWAEYGDRVEQIACGLDAIGLAPGDVAGIVSATRLEWGLADLGILTRGATTVTVYPTLLAEDTEYILGHAEATVCLVEDEDQLAKIRSVRDRLPHLKHLIVLSGRTDGGNDALTFDELAEKGRAARDATPHRWRGWIERVAPDDLATLVYTSGTTGPPKGVMLTHANFVKTCEGLHALGLTSGQDHGISYLPLSHIYERISTYMYSMYSGGTYGIARSLENLIEDIQTIAPTTMVGVPRVYEKIHAGILRNLQDQSPIAKKLFHWAIDLGRKTSPYRKRGDALPAALAVQHALADRLIYRKIRGRFGGRLRFLCSAAAPIASEILDFFDALGIQIVEGFGMTECTGPATLTNLAEARIGWVGKPLAGTRIRIASDGEIQVSGYNVFAGYFKDPAQTADTLVDGWLLTGDIGEIDPDGYLRITDRKKDLIITAGGKNIAPQNLENRIKMDPLIAEAFVYGDRKKFLSALLTVDPEQLARWAAANGRDGEPAESLVKLPELIGEVDRRVRRINDQFARFETIKKFVLLPGQFSIESGELTPTMKLKRKVVVARYGELLDALYED